MTTPLQDRDKLARDLRKRFGGLGPGAHLLKSDLALIREAATALAHPREELEVERVPSEPGFDPSRGCQFRKRPVVIEAVRFLRVATEAETHFDGPVPAWLDDAMEAGRIRASLAAGGPKLLGRLFIKTPEGEMAADAGDWIIRGVKGELYPCKPDIFAATYEQCDSDRSPEGGDAEGGSAVDESAGHSEAEASHDE